MLLIFLISPSAGEQPAAMQHEKSGGQRPQATAVSRTLTFLAVVAVFVATVRIR